MGEKGMEIGKWQTDRLESADTYRIFNENFVERVHHDIPLTFVKDLNALSDDFIIR